MTEDFERKTIPRRIARSVGMPGDPFFPPLPERVPVRAGGKHGKTTQPLTVAVKCNKCKETVTVFRGGNFPHPAGGTELLVTYDDGKELPVSGEAPCICARTAILQRVGWPQKFSTDHPSDGWPFCEYPPLYDDLPPATTTFAMATTLATVEDPDVVAARYGWEGHEPECRRPLDHGELPSLRFQCQTPTCRQRTFTVARSTVVTPLSEDRADIVYA